MGELLGKYRVQEQLGEGGMGVVYVGRHEALGHRVVVKVLRPELSSNTDVVRRFFNEALAATAIRHPSIVQVFDSGMTRDGQAYYVMELLDGETLTKRIQERWLDSIECCRIGRQIANALQATHEAGIIHRDLKPDNLFLVTDAEVAGGTRVKVLDFGLAKLAIELQASGVHTRADLVMGTPSYMAPEQCRGAGEVDPRSDIYALGCNLFKMMCGRPPFVGRGPGEILGAHQFVPAPDLRRYAPTVVPELAALIAQMLEKQPEARPQEMAAVSQALAEILCSLDGTPVCSSGSHPIQPPAAPWRDATTTTTPTLETSPASSHLTTLPEASPAPRFEQGITAPRVSSLATTLPWAVLKTRPNPAAATTWTDRPPRETQSVSVPMGLLPTPLPAALPRYDATPTPAYAPSPPSMPSLSWTSTTPGGSAGMTIADDPPGRRRRRRLLVGFVVAGVVIAIAIAIAIATRYASEPAGPGPADTMQPPSPTTGAGHPAEGAADVRMPADGATAAAQIPAEGAAAAGQAPTETPGAAAGQMSANGGPAAVAPAAAAEGSATASGTAPPPKASEIEAECRGYLVDQEWNALRQCAGRLKPLAPESAAKLEVRAAAEIRSEERLAGVAAALRDQDLLRAKRELDQAWTGSIGYKRAKKLYDAAEDQAIAALVTQLERVKDADCEEYNALLAKERAAKPPRVATEAAGRTACTPRPRCDADGIAAKAHEQYVARDLTGSLASYDQALACGPSPALAQKALIVACNLNDAAKAKSYWKQLSPLLRQQAIGTCVRNGITEEMLNTP